jgi:mannose-6-phosphate isomerase
MPLYELRNPVQHYDWGSRTAIPHLLGQPVPSERPCAELWIGAHPSAPSEVRTPAGWRSLRDWIAEQPGPVLGERARRRFGDELPFLLKVLAVEQPLSLQAHPNAAQARAGFERENRAGLAAGDPARSFSDPRAKPELLCAVAPVRALCGFRPLEESRALAAPLGVPELGRLLAEPTPGAALARLLRLGAGERSALVDAVVRALPAAASDPPRAWVRTLAAAWPGDPGALAPLLLHCVELAPGEALFLRPGALHTYLGGVGVEVLANSDNVLRGGLTRKHVDVDSLLAILDPQAACPARVPGETGADGVRRYAAPVEEFALAVLRPPAGRGLACAPSGGPELLLCFEGEARVAAGGEPPRRLGRGQALLVPACQAGYRLEGDATLYRASLPPMGADETGRPAA